MIKINLDENWTYRKGFLDSLGMLEAVDGICVNLPHDGMIATKVDADAPGGYDWGYFRGDCGNYTKYVSIPAEWKDESVGLRFDGAMMHIIVEINGYKVASHHYGYSPFYVDITPYIAFGEDNRITVNYNTGIEPSCRWYPGAGLFRSLELCHGPKVHVANNGVSVVTREIDGDIAFLEAQIEVCNESGFNALAEVAVEITTENNPELCANVKRLIQINPNKTETAIIPINLRNPILWNAENPNLYRAKVTVNVSGEYRTHFIENTQGQDQKGDVEECCFGVRTITADAVRGLRINGETVKLKGGCIHHDNGLLGAVSVYACEERKVRKLKSIGFNAIRTAHNPPSSALLEACDRVGMYVLDEAFDAWGVAKRIGDYSNFFEHEWEKDITDFIKRDRLHPSVIIWSIGNEIPERGGLANGYTLATAIARKVKSIDTSRPVCNGICSYWSGLDDYLSKGMDHTQNASEDPNTRNWEKRSEPFTNGLDIVGYNYLEDHYESDHRQYPERVILGTETFPQEIGFRWPKVQELDYVIGDFTWTAWDYLGEAGIGKALYLDKEDPFLQRGPWGVMPPATTVYPWRLANDADFDITGRILPQGEYRSVVWGSKNTYLYSMHPDVFGKEELMSMWGFPMFRKHWNYSGCLNKPIEVVVFSSADEVELRINGNIIGRKRVQKVRAGKCGQPFVNTVKFNTTYVPGIVEAISYTEGREISRDSIKTTKNIAGIALTSDKKRLIADGHDLLYVEVDVVDEDGNVVPDGTVQLTAEVSGTGYLAGFGTGKPITEEDYTDIYTDTYNGHAVAIVRSGYQVGEVSVNIRGTLGETIWNKSLVIPVNR